MARKAPTPRRGVPALIKAVRAKARAENISGLELARQSGVSSAVGTRLLGKHPQESVKHVTEDRLRNWLASWETDVPDTPPRRGNMVDPNEDATPSAQDASPVRAAVDFIREKLDVPIGKVGYVYEAVETALELQAEASAELVSNLETDLAVLRAEREDLVARLVAVERKRDLDDSSALVRELQASANKAETQNQHLRAAIKSLTQVL